MSFVAPSTRQAGRIWRRMLSRYSLENTSVSPEIEIDSWIQEKILEGQPQTQLEKIGKSLPSLPDWATRYRRIDGHFFTLARHKPLEQLNKDEHPKKEVIKP